MATYAKFDTTEGSFTVKLFEAEAPNTVANFVGLAEGTKEWTDPKTGQKKLYQVEATGNVIIDNKGDIAKAAKAVYNMDSDIATLDGGVKITRGKNQLNGEHAIYDTKTGKAKVTGGKGQVKTLLVPGSDKNMGGTLMPGTDKPGTDKPATDSAAGGTQKP